MKTMVIRAVLVVVLLAVVGPSQGTLLYVVGTIVGSWLLV